ncbi:gamma-glutamylcyclotransferase [Blautia pseudococcoides]|nr:gamma-glutamylcyclotransferase [Blautia pseudococcoides]
MEKYYIAYGSNMDEGQMAYRCPTAQLLGRTELEDYRLLFKGSKTGAYATIEPEERSRVPVLVWIIGKEDEKSLDRYEGYPVFYYKKDLEIDLDGKRLTAMAYIMDESREYGKPSEGYYGVLERAYRKYGFPMEILTEAYKISGENGGGV